MILETAEPRWAGRRCVVAASGPSLAPDVAEACRGELVIAVNDAYRLIPNAAVLYACDMAWWQTHAGCPNFAGERWTSHSLSPKNDKTASADKFGLRVIAGANGHGFSRDPSRIHYASNSGFQAVNLAILFGASMIILCGFDMHGGHFFGAHPPPLKSGSSFAAWIASFARAAQLLGPSPRILNATPGSALTCFPMVDLAEVLGMAEAA